ALGYDHDYVAAMTGLGAIEEAKRRPGAALERLDEAIEVDPNQADAHLRRGRALEALGRTDEALAAYFRTLEFAPNSTEARLRVATLQLDHGEPDQALARLDAVTEQDPENAEARHQRGRAHLALQHLPQALDDLKFAAGRLKDRPDVHYHLAVALAADHETGAALEAAGRALALAPDYAEALILTQKLRR
ncbi:MAG: tetratricopeptide repeat protein, partial [Planctomycetia bacterium]|nr:tetratricopeptide repeat protein [Planctomycetia bacterium]